MQEKEKSHQVAGRLARTALRGLDPVVTAYKSDTCYVRDPKGGGNFEVRFWGRDYQISYPDGDVRELGTEKTPNLAVQLLLLHYLTKADGTLLADHWVAFRELPDALVYDAALQGRTSLPLARAYGCDLEGFIAAARALGGDRLSFGDASFMFQILPRVRMAIVLHLADDEFPAAVTVLFDAVTGHYLPTEDLAVLGGMFCGALVKHKG
ncbi:MAG: DUF3786 domain-containing protein [Chloroflexota bacterium]|nr:DUF3786 domain-containing protein [Anaerolineae bacterium]